MTNLLTKQKITDILNTASYPKNEYWVTAGAGLVMHGVKSTTRDIDMGCTSLLADMLIQKGAKWEYLDDSNRKIEPLPGLELFENWNVDCAVLIDGVSVASLCSIRKQKAELNRAKDWDDISLIDKYLKMHPSQRNS